MEIAKGISNSDYNSLDLSNHSSNNWNIAADIFEKRFYHRYIEPVDLLIASETKLLNTDKRFGFTIAAIDSLLIETLACFYAGYIESPRRQNEAVYVGFLTNPALEIASHFDHNSAALFYNEIRCGILHQSETKNNSLIKAWGPAVRVQNGSIVINRTAFHTLVKKEFESYIKKIRTSSNVDLRGKFVTKMTHICR